MSARILVVDDEPDLKALVLQKFRQQIRDRTVDFLFAHDGVEALAALKANGGIDLVVTDINMPRMDGLALLQKLQESDENISTIIVSAGRKARHVSTADPRHAGTARSLHRHRRCRRGAVGGGWSYSERRQRGVITAFRPDILTAQRTHH